MVLPATPEMPPFVVLFASSLSLPKPALVPPGFSSPLKLMLLPTLTLVELAVYSAWFWRSVTVSVPSVENLFFSSSIAFCVLVITPPVRQQGFGNEALA